METIERLAPIEAQLQTISAMHSFRRPAGSKTERRFINEYLRPLGVSTDRAGNLIKRIGTAPVLWSSHTDTVHRSGGTQRTQIRDTVLSLAKSETESNCLGADCTAGVWIMREMILANRPGLYVFHRGEECGGVGSSFIAEKTPALLDGIEFAIAFDRRKATSIITHQFDRCCSDTFAASLGMALGGTWDLDRGGTFTDTAQYTGLIGECSNLSVGFDNEHTKRETLDLRHLLTLRDRMLALDVSELISERVAGETDTDDYLPPDPWDINPRNDNSNHWPTMAEMVRQNPDAVVDLLEAYGMDAQSLSEEIYYRGGAVRY